MGYYTDETMEDRKDERIERLEAEVARLREALVGITKPSLLIRASQGQWPDNQPVGLSNTTTYGDYRRAADALSDTADEQED